MRTRQELVDLIPKLKPAVVNVDNFGVTIEAFERAADFLAEGVEWRPMVISYVVRVFHTHPNIHVREIAKELLHYRKLPKALEDAMRPRLLARAVEQVGRGDEA